MDEKNLTQKLNKVSYNLNSMNTLTSLCFIATRSTKFIKVCAALTVAELVSTVALVASAINDEIKDSRLEVSTEQ